MKTEIDAGFTTGAVACPVDTGLGYETYKDFISFEPDCFCDTRLRESNGIYDGQKIPPYSMASFFKSVENGGNEVFHVSYEGSQNYVDLYFVNQINARNNTNAHVFMRLYSRSGDDIVRDRFEELKFYSKNQVPTGNTMGVVVALLEPVYFEVMWTDGRKPTTCLFVDLTSVKIPLFHKQGLKLEFQRTLTHMAIDNSVMEIKDVVDQTTEILEKLKKEEEERVKKQKEEKEKAKIMQISGGVSGSPSYSPHALSLMSQEVKKLEKERQEEQKKKEEEKRKKEEEVKKKSLVTGGGVSKTVKKGLFVWWTYNFDPAFEIINDFSIPSTFTDLYIKKLLPNGEGFVLFSIFNWDILKGKTLPDIRNNIDTSVANKGLVDQYDRLASGFGTTETLGDLFLFADGKGKIAWNKIGVVGKGLLAKKTAFEEGITEFLLRIQPNFDALVNESNYDTVTNFFVVGEQKGFVTEEKMKLQGKTVPITIQTAVQNLVSA